MGPPPLFNLIASHPKIQIGGRGDALEEIHFFSTKWDKGLDWYSQQFISKRAGNLIGEKSPSYFHHPLVPARIAETCPNVKLILMLRNPVDRAYSHYLKRVQQGYEKAPTFEEALLLEEQRLASDEDPWNKYELSNAELFSYKEMGFYAEHLRLWYNYFQRDQILLVKSEQMWENPQWACAMFYRFLGVEPYVHAPYSKRWQATKAHADMRLETREMLTGYYQASNAELQKLTGIGWN